MSINPYTKEEVERISKIKETNDKLEEFFLSKRNDWNKSVYPLFKILSDHFTRESFTKVLDIQATALSYRQEIVEQINLFLNKRSKEYTKVKKIRQDKFIFYATGFGIKTNLGEKGILIDAHLAENDRTIELIDSYIDFLRDTSKNLESLGYSIKNMIELANYLK